MRQADCKLVLPGSRVGVTALMTERVTRCHDVTAADTYDAEGEMDGEG